MMHEEVAKTLIGTGYAFPQSSALKKQKPEKQIESEIFRYNNRRGLASPFLKAPL